MRWQILNAWNSPSAGQSVNGYGVINLVVLSQIKSWMIIVCFTLLAAMPDVIIAYVRTNYFPAEWQASALLHPLCSTLARSIWTLLGVAGIMIHSVD